MALVPVGQSQENIISGNEETMLCSCAVGGKFVFLGYGSTTEKKPAQMGTAQPWENSTLCTSQSVQASQNKSLMIMGLTGAGYVMRLNFFDTESSSREECGGRMGGEQSPCPRACMHRRVGRRHLFVHKQPLSYS